MKHLTPAPLADRSSLLSCGSLRILLAAVSALALGGCAHDLGTGSEVVADLQTSHPTTVGRLVTAYLDPSRRLRVYLQICRDADGDGPVCLDEDLRVLAMVESGQKKLLERLAARYLQDGSEKPVYVYGPMCDGFEEMILVPRCQNAMAIGIWDPHLRDYIVYSTLHGDSLIRSEGFENFLAATGRAAGVVGKAAKAM